jgi:hypothetical protein
MDLAGLQTGGANLDFLNRSVNIRPDRLKIRIPAPVNHIMSVRDGITETRLLSAYFAHFCHIRNLLFYYSRKASSLLFFQTLFTANSVKFMGNFRYFSPLDSIYLKPYFAGKYV